MPPWKITLVGIVPFDQLLCHQFGVWCTQSLVISATAQVFIVLLEWNRGAGIVCGTGAMASENAARGALAAF